MNAEQPDPMCPVCNQPLVPGCHDTTEEEAR